MGLSFLAPGFLWLLLGVPAVALLHVVRARARRREASALFLWARAVEAAQRRRRFRASWLLALQILAVVAAALGLARPTLLLDAAPDRVLVVDASAGMAARDPEGVRLERARERAAEELREGGRVAVVRAGLEPVVVLPPTADRAEARAALEAIRAGDREADLERAAELARAVAPGARVVVLTDAPPPAPEAATGTALEGARFVNVAGEGRNLGIVAFDLGVQEAFVSVASNDPRPRQARVEIRRADDPPGAPPLASADVLVPGNGRTGRSFPLEPAGGALIARVTPLDGGDDALALDDEAWVGRDELRVLVERGGGPLERAFAAVPGVRVSATPNAAVAPAADARVLIGDDLSAAPPGDVLLAPDPTLEAEFVRVRDADRADPLLRFVDLRDVTVGVPVGLRLPDDEPGWRVLARGPSFEPLIRVREGPQGTLVQLAFAPERSDLALRPAFPTFIANVADAFRDDERLPLGATLPPGATSEGRAADRALEPGPYLVDGRTVVASLLSEAETRLPGPAPAPAPEGASDGSGGGAVARDRGAALPLLALAALALLAEWWLWARGERRGPAPGRASGR